MTRLRAVVNALGFRERDTQGLQSILARDWPDLLDQTDREHLTLALGVRCREVLPEWARARIDRNLADNAARYERLVQVQRRIGDAFALRKIEFAVLKGLSLRPYYSEDPRHRPQYDIDIYVPPASLAEAAAAARALGYEPLTDVRDPLADHIPVMIPKTGWKWRGNYFDPEMPPSLELHDQFWNPQLALFDVEGVDTFWRRRVAHALDPVDGLSYAALHLVRHRLIGDLRLRHVYEMAHFLERSAKDDAFWEEWRASGLHSCRSMEGIAFRLASAWFHCDMHPAAREAMDQLPQPVKRWFRLFGDTPDLITGPPNKNELWLHFCLVESHRDRRAILRRRFFPARSGRVVLDAHVPAAKPGLSLRAKRLAFEVWFMAMRFFHHVRALAPTLRGAWLWWRRE